MADLGEAYMLRKPGQQTEHLWVLVTRAHPDNGDHPFITRPSVVFYADARPVDPGIWTGRSQPVAGEPTGPLRPRCWRASRPAWSFRRLRRTR